MATTNDLKNGMVLKLDGQLWQVIWFQHHKPGKGGGDVPAKLRSISSGKTVDKTFNADVKVEVANVDKRTMQYLYNDGTSFVFMDTSSYEQLEVSPEVVGDATNFLLENQEAIVATNDGDVLYIELPASVELEVTYTEPGLQGDRSTGGTKPATLETGHQISVPLFICERRADQGRHEGLLLPGSRQHLIRQPRSKARKRALDLIYASEMRNRSTDDALVELSDVGPVNEYTVRLVEGVTANLCPARRGHRDLRQGLDDGPDAGSGPQRPAPAAFEVLYVDEVPFAVSVSEALNLVRRPVHRRVARVRQRRARQHCPRP